MTLWAQVKAMTERGLSAEAIAARTGAKLATVQVYRSRLKKPSHYRAVRIARLRRLGGRPKADLVAASQAQWARIQPLLARGMTWAKAAETLGITKGVIAGLAYRKRRGRTKQGETGCACQPSTDPSNASVRKQARTIR